MNYFWAIKSARAERDEARAERDNALRERDDARLRNWSYAQDVNGLRNQVERLRVMVAGRDREIFRLQMEVQNRGCARDQNTTQYCAEAVDWQAKYDREAEMSDGLRKANNRLIESLSHLTKLGV